MDSATPEEMIARALQGHTPRPFIFTKCERVWDSNGNLGASLKADSIRRECEDSLRRAGLLTGAMTRERVAKLMPEDWRKNLPNQGASALAKPATGGEFA
jgi:hypothetical protein